MYFDKKKKRNLLDTWKITLVMHNLRKFPIKIVQKDLNKNNLYLNNCAFTTQKNHKLVVDFELYSKFYNARMQFSMCAVIYNYRFVVYL